MYLGTLWIYWTFLTCIVTRGYGKYILYQQKFSECLFTFVLFLENARISLSWILSTICLKCFTSRTMNLCRFICTIWLVVHITSKYHSSELVASFTAQWSCHCINNHLFRHLQWSINTAFWVERKGPNDAFLKKKTVYKGKKLM